MSFLHSLAGKHAVITGGTGALGHAIATTFASHGATVTLLGRHASLLESTVSSLPLDPTSESHSYHVAHVSNAESLQEAAQAISKRRDVNVLVNAAGISQNRLLMGLLEEEMMKIVNTNLVGTILACKYFTKSLMRSSKTHGDASIINISSLLAITGGRGASVYAATKAGVVGLTRSLAAELAPRIRVNSLLPGYIDSKMVSDIVPTTSDALTKQIPLKRLGTPQEVAHAALFLIQNRYANNCTLNLDGGLSVGPI